MRKTSIIILIILFIPSIAFPHKGRTDSSGGHNDRKTGEYHYHNSGKSKSTSPEKVISGTLHLCTRVVDGDTIVINYFYRKEKVRLIGVDTPETKHPKKPVEYFGKEASAFTKQMVESKKIRLEFDQNQRDKYKRLLAYVYLEDGTFLNAEIVKQGYGHAYTKYPFMYMEQFKEYEKEARVNKRGLWK